jgi:hypothetical protein
MGGSRQAPPRRPSPPDRWHQHVVGRRMQRNPLGTMPKPAAFYSFAILGLTVACTRASFSLVEDGSSRDLPADPASSGGNEPVEARTCPAPPVPGCTSQNANGAPCDPVCQTGNCDWCGEKCTVDGNGAPVCASVGVKAARSSCTIELGGNVSQHDNCTPGNICLSPDTGSGYAYCFPLCRSNLDCLGGVACGRRPISPIASATPVLVSVCDPEYLSCNPSSAAPCCNPLKLTGCPLGQYCYLVSPDPQGDSRTVCEYTTGLGTRTPCNSSRDCYPGYGCASSGNCQKVCDPNATTNTCDGRPCTASGNQFGYCPP